MVPRKVNPKKAHTVVGGANAALGRVDTEFETLLQEPGDIGHDTLACPLAFDQNDKVICVTCCAGPDLEIVVSEKKSEPQNIEQEIINVEVKGPWLGDSQLLRSEFLVGYWTFVFKK